VSGIIILIWAIGAVIGFVLTLRATAAETTAHGQGIILPMGILLSIFWPLAFAWIALIGLGFLVDRVWRWIRSLVA